ncbi:hypothetical protein CC2G_001994 [Coprinopsis cinerea AmutBmut pab1-1]|nr:hypothetical protein CC2G_001994 [Coprinopsis cinerea AmutBmut pab1-1]
MGIPRHDLQRYILGLKRERAASVGKSLQGVPSATSGRLLETSVLLMVMRYLDCLPEHLLGSKESRNRTAHPQYAGRMDCKVSFNTFASAGATCCQHIALNGSASLQQQWRLRKFVGIKSRTDVTSLHFPVPRV